MPRLTTKLLLALLCLTLAAPALAGSGSKPKPRGGSGSRNGSDSRSASAGPPAIGDSAPTAPLASLVGEPIDLAASFSEGRTVLIVLRGYPGYQCPICSRIVQGFIREAPAFAKENVSVIMVYPGAEANLTTQAEEFLAGKELPKPLSLALDPDYQLVNAYGIRWNAPNETAYPSTFIIDDGEIVWSKVSKTHGGRASAKAVLAALRETAR